MRGLLFFINLILLFTAAGLIAANWKFRKAPDDVILKWRTPETLESESNSIARREPPQLAMIRSNNLFSPLRGKEPVQQNGEVEKKNAPPKFELIGICSLGEEAGAIIDTKGGNPGSKERPRKYFAVGEEVASGFVLDSVAESTVILKRKNETIELKIDHRRFGAEVGKSKSVQPQGGPSTTPPPTIAPGRRGEGAPPPGNMPRKQ